MTPRILEYEDGRIKVTAEAYMIPELKALIDKYDMDAEPYLAYAHLMSAVDSPYINYEYEERNETVIYDIINTIGDFDTDEPLLIPAVEKLQKMFSSAVRDFFDELKEELHRLRRYLKENPIQDGKEGNLTERIRIIEKVGIILANYKKAEAQADDELKMATRGDQETGMY
jgi:hypothetical protein